MKHSDDFIKYGWLVESLKLIRDSAELRRFLYVLTGVFVYYISIPVITVLINKLL